MTGLPCGAPDETKAPPAQIAAGDGFEPGASQADPLPAANPAAALCLAHLDNLEAITQALGQGAADELFRQAADRLRFAVGDTGSVAPFGVEALAVTLTGSVEPKAAEAFGAHLVELLGRIYLIAGQPVKTTVSVALALADDGDARQPGQRLRNARIALGRARSEGGNRHRLFTRDMHAEIEARLRLEGDLRKALGLRQFALFYQPLYNFAAGRVTGFEALLRWRHPERGMISPAQFIPLAEQLGLIVPIGEWALRTACREAAGWPGSAYVAVNVSPVQFNANALVSAVAAALGKFGLDPARLLLEITEGVLLQDSAATMEKLHALKRMGVRIAMDDFGTGYASLGSLRSFPFDKIKIDQSFIRTFPERDDAAPLIRAFAAIGAALGMEVTAEGVETRAQMVMVASNGCTDCQGYFIAKPLPASDLDSFHAGPSLPPFA